MKPYYEDGSVTIYHGDCRELLPTLDFDALIADPPYGVGLAGKSTRWTAKSGIGYTKFDDTPEEVEREVIPTLMAAVQRGRAVITPGLRMMWAYPRPDAIGAIFYPSGAGPGRWGFTCWQPILYYGKDPYLAKGLGSRPDSFSSTEAAEVNGHPVPKPLGAMRWLVNKGSLPGELVLDPYMGSGTTLRAAKDLGRRAIGIEIEERYCEIAARRCSQEVLGLAV